MLNMPIEFLRYSSKNPTIYPSIGRCIYCGNGKPGTLLTNEDIFPIALGGGAIFRRASCVSCAKVTSGIEDILRRTYGTFRTKANFRTRRPKQRPTHSELLIEHPRGSGKLLKAKVPLPKYPLFLPLPRFHEPGILRHDPIGLPLYYSLTTFGNSNDIQLLVEEYGGKISNCSPAQPRWSGFGFLGRGSVIFG